MTSQYFSLQIMIFIIAGLSPIALEAQSEKLQTPKDQTGKTEYYLESNTSLYLELLGKGFYSINVDYRKDTSTAMSVGLQWVEDAFLPSFMYYYLYGETFRTEVGGGVSGVFTTKDGLAGIGIHGDYGYRYQKKNGLLFRINFTPFIGIPLKSSGRFMIVPWGGVSVGYSF